MADAKPVAEVDIVCPKCEAKLKVTVTKEKVEEARFDFEAIVVEDKEQNLPGVETSS